MPDVVVVGGGVIGLTLAYELSVRGRSVLLLEQGEIGKEASWAGAGMLPPGNFLGARTPEALLRGLSASLWSDFSAKLRDETGLDNGYRRCGSLSVGVQEDAARLRQEIAQWQNEKIDLEELENDALQELEPLLHEDWMTGYYLPDGAQIRNPWHVRALHAACLARGVHISTGTQVSGFEMEGERVQSVKTLLGNVAADQVVICSGAWAGQLLPKTDAEVFVRPVRGQMVLLNQLPGAIAHTIEWGHQYLVPREGGRILVGSTMEHAGFEKRNTVEGVLGLLHLAYRLVPHLAEATVEKTWSGLRPASADGLPYLGAVPETRNLFIAAGHFRTGLQMSPGTGKVMAQLLCGENPEIPLQPFSCDLEIRRQQTESVAGKKGASR